MLDIVAAHDVVHRVGRVVRERTHLFQMVMRAQYILVASPSLATPRLLRSSALSATAPVTTSHHVALLVCRPAAARAAATALGWRCGRGAAARPAFSPRLERH